MTIAIEAAISIAAAAAAATRPTGRKRPRDVFTRDLDLPRGRDVNVRASAIASTTSTVRRLGCWRLSAHSAWSPSELSALRDDARKPRQSIRHLEEGGLIRRSPLDANDRAVVLTERGRDLLEADRSISRDERKHEPRQVFYAGLRKPRELTHDVKVYRAFERTEHAFAIMAGAFAASFSTTR